MTPELWPSGLVMSKNTVPLVVQSAYGVDGYFDVAIYWNFDWQGVSYGADPLAVQRLYADEAGYIELDIKTILNDAFLDRFHVPYAGDAPSSMIFASAMLVINELYAGTVMQTLEFYFKVWHGGIPRPARHWEFPLDFPYYMESNTKWLTWKPDKSKLSKDQDEYLYHLNPTAAVTDITYHFELHDDNGSIYTQDSTQATAGLDHEMMIINAGYDANDLGDLLPAGKIPIKYTVKAYETGNASNTIAEQRTFYVDNNYQPFEKRLYFSNSLGCMDCLRLVGESTPQTNYEDVDVDTHVSLRTNTSRWASTGARLESKETESDKKLTGWIRKDDIQWLRDLRLSQLVLLYDSQGYHIPIRLTKKELPLPKDNQDLYSVTLEYELIETQTTWAPPRTAYYTP